MPGDGNDEYQGAETPQLTAQLDQLKSLKAELEAAEDQNRGINAGSATTAKLAGCADLATFAWQATEAEFAVMVGGKRDSLGEM